MRMRAAAAAQMLHKTSRSAISISKFHLFPRFLTVSRDVRASSRARGIKLLSEGQGGPFRASRAISRSALLGDAIVF